MGWCGAPRAHLGRPWSRPTTRGMGRRKQHRLTARGAHRHPAFAPEHPLESSGHKAMASMAVHSQDGHRHARGASAHRLGVEEGIEAMASPCSDMPPSTSCPHHAARRSTGTTVKFGCTHAPLGIRSGYSVASGCGLRAGYGGMG